MPFLATMVEPSRSTSLCEIIDSSGLANFLKLKCAQLLLIDSRSFMEFNSGHIQHSVNVNGSKLVKRRLEQDKMCVRDFLTQSCRVQPDEDSLVVVYDHCSTDATALSPESFSRVLLQKLRTSFKYLNFLKGGFLEFNSKFPTLCESKAPSQICRPLTMSLSHPCLPGSSQGPTKILPFLFLGSQEDALNDDVLRRCNITHILNVSQTCPANPNFQGIFKRISVNDCVSAKLHQHFPEAIEFIDSARRSDSCVLVHCLAGISRSPTLSIAYVMQHHRMTSEQAYKFIKDKRPMISPNFNFLGQLLEWENDLRKLGVLPRPDEGEDGSSSKRQCTRRHKPLSATARKMGKTVSLDLSKARPSLNPSPVSSPTAALSKLSFNSPASDSSQSSATPTNYPDTVPQTPTVDKPLSVFTREFALNVERTEERQWKKTTLSSNSLLTAQAVTKSVTCDDLHSFTISGPKEPASMEIDSDTSSILPTLSLESINFTPCDAHQLTWPPHIIKRKWSHHHPNQIVIPVTMEHTTSDSKRLQDGTAEKRPSEAGSPLSDCGRISKSLENVSSGHPNSANATSRSIHSFQQKNGFRSLRIIQNAISVSTSATATISPNHSIAKSSSLSHIAPGSKNSSSPSTPTGGNHTSLHPEVVVT